MAKPLIAVAPYSLAPGRVQGWEDGALAVPQDYSDALARAGGRGVALIGAEADELEPFGALLLIGGGDVDPARYGASQRHPDVYDVNPARDESEFDLLRAAATAGLPVLAICRGIQVVNVAFGGTLHQHVPDVPGMDGHRAGFLHEVKVAEGSRLAEATDRTSLQGWSAHHQGIDRLASGFAAVGWSGDGLVEAIEAEDGWIVGVQWHPEHTAAKDSTQQALFDALVERARG